MKITSISPQKRNPERVNVHVDGAFRIALAAEIVYAAPLRVGDLVTDAQLAELELRDQTWKAREAALNLLSFRPRTAAELRRRLREKGFDEAIADECAAALEQRGLVDDSSFAEMFVRDRVRLRPRGRRRLVQELRSRGVDAETAGAAIAEVWANEGVSDVDLAREVAAKWSPRTGEERLRARRRLFGFLARRGFSGETARTVIDERLPE